MMTTLTAVPERSIKPPARRSEIELWRPTPASRNEKLAVRGANAQLSPKTSRGSRRGISCGVMVALAAHLSVAAVLATVKLQYEEPPSIVFSTGSLHILSEEPAAPDGFSGTIEVAAEEPVVDDSCPALVAMQNSSVLMTPIPAEPIAIAAPVIGVSVSSWQTGFTRPAGVADVTSEPVQPTQSAGAGVATVNHGSAGGGAVGQSVAARYNPRPAYPRVAVKNGWEGVTLLRIEVLPTGRAGSVEVVRSSGHSVLDEAAIEAVRHWRFNPARNGDMAVTQLVEQPVVFQLDRG